MLNRPNLCRTLIVAGLLVGLLSWRETVGHIGDPQYVLPASFSGGATHAWYHALRESLSDVAQMLVFLAVFFGPASLRTGATWWLLLVLMLGYYAPFWVGAPVLPALAAPNAVAEAIHVAMAGLTLSGLLLAKPLFSRRPSTAVEGARP